VQKVFSPLLQIGLCTFGYLYATSEMSLAQVTTDGTVNTQVIENGNVAEITGGEARGSNLFHSFQEFSVGTGNEAFFNNANNISNIFSRVTGGKISSIDGLIRANGSANLFLINPAGILFGENARLDVGGSFLGSTASSVLFEDGEFSATDLENPPVLTINAPIGLNFRDEPGDITVRGNGQGTRRPTDLTGNASARGTGKLIDTQEALRVNTNKTFALAGGNLLFEGATIKTAGGRIELGSVGGNQQVGFIPVNEGFSLDYAGVKNFQDIQLSQTVTVDASGVVAGDIKVQGQNISLLEGSQIEASTIGKSPSQDTPGTVEINALDTINVDGSTSDGIFSGVASRVYTSAVGDAGDVTISTTNLNLTNSGAIDTSTSGAGNGGDININTSNLTLANEGRIDTSTSGAGHSGDININATESVSIKGGFDPLLTGIQSFVSAEGNGGVINITTPNFTVANGGLIITNTNGVGDGGEININATESVTVDGENLFTLIASQVSAEGNGGVINITTPNLTVANNGAIDTSTSGAGDGGAININATESATVTDAYISSNVFVFNVFGVPGGNGGAINVTTPNLTVANNGAIDTSTSTVGNAGSILIKADTLSLNNSGIYAENIPFEPATNNQAPNIGGNITLEITDDLTLRNNSTISAKGGSNADGGNVNIDTNFIVAFPEGNNDILANAEQGKGGNININAQAILGIAERPLNDLTNDINASSQVRGLDGTVNLNTLGINPVQGATELPSNVVEPEKTTTQTCQANRDGTAKNGLTIKGKGGVPPAPDLPLNSQNISVNGEIDPTISTIPEPIETSLGKIQPARGIKVTKDGRVTLTAYRTNNAGERIPEIKPNCN